MTESLIEFYYQPRIQLLFGNQSIDRIGEQSKALGGKRILIVSDKGIVSAGHVEHAQNALRKEGLETVVFDDVIENPTTDTVDACVAFAKSENIDFIIGLGGGSSMDTAKGCNFILTNGGSIKDYWGVGKATKPMLPLIAVPTTAGTGSECQSFALISDAETHVKMACGDSKAAPKLAILDPALTLSQPPSVAACTGIDAIVHAVETAVTKKRNPISMMFSKEAFKLTHRSFPAIFNDQDSIEARGAMLLGAAYAGTAIENSMLGAAHASANPLTANYGITHGQAVGVMLPSVIRFNAQQPDIKRLYYRLMTETGMMNNGLSEEHAVHALADRIIDLLQCGSLKQSLEELGVPKGDIPKLAEEASKQWTGNFNPRDVNTEAFIQIYGSAYSG